MSTQTYTDFTLCVCVCVCVGVSACMCSVSLNIWILKYWKHENSFKYKYVCVYVYITRLKSCLNYDECWCVCFGSSNMVWSTQARPNSTQQRCSLKTSTCVMIPHASTRPCKELTTHIETVQIYQTFDPSVIIFFSIPPFSLFTASARQLHL